MAGIDIFELVPPEASLDPDQELTLFHPAEMELSETTKNILDRVVAIKILLDMVREIEGRTDPAFAETSAFTEADEKVIEQLRARFSKPATP